MRPSENLTKLIDGLEQYVSANGATNEAIENYIAAAHYAFRQEHNAEYGIKIAERGKELLADRIKQTLGIDIEQLDEMCKNNNAEMEEVNLYWQLELEESPYRFESFIEYMEKNRPYAKKFYAPRKGTLKVVVDDLQRLEDGYFQFYGLSMPSRVGKALAYDTPVLTKNGWKNHGDLTIRDEVIGLDGEFKKILAIHNPCEMEYKVTFSDGESIICHGNHEWVADLRSGKQIVIETKEMAKCLHEKDGHARYIVPKHQIVSGLHTPVWVDPYTLGAWLGDGRNTNPDICGAESDYAIVQKIIDNGYSLAWDTKHKTTGVRYYGFRGLREDLQRYGMCYSRKTVPKRIPAEYLTADIEQRLELLAGLLDTDGSLRKEENRYSFTTAEPLLKDDFLALIGTFGWRTCVVKYEPHVSSSGVVGRRAYWTISFNPTMYIPCVLERKQLKTFSKQRSVTFEKIEPVSGKMGNCITVEGGIYCVGKTLKPTHNSTICIFFLCWIAFKKPNSHNAMGGHSGILARGFYKELLNFMTSEEYTFYEIYKSFHEYGSFMRDKSAEELSITLGAPDRFPTIRCAGIDATWTGAVDISKDGYLYVDDLVRDRQHSLSPTRMEETFQEYLNKMVDRKNDGAKELMVGTLWNVLDPLERLRKQYAGDSRYFFRRIPALDENDESNFQYKVNGFSTAYYRDMRKRLDAPEWMAKYQQQPFVREGLLFPIDELRYFNGIIADEVKCVKAVCDPAFGGGDSLSMPICLETYSGDKFIIAWVFSRLTQKYTLPKICDAIERYHIVELLLERNNGGRLFEENIKKELVARGVIFCKVHSKSAPNGMAKEDKIKGYSDFVKDNFIFLEPLSNEPYEVDDTILAYKRDEDYQAAMNEMTMYTSEGKNPHEDAADSIVQLAMTYEVAQRVSSAKAVHNPFSGGGY